MRSIRPAVLWAAMFAAPVLRADVTVRYKHDVKAALPQATAAIPSALTPQFTVIRVKGDKAYSDLGAFASILDAGTGQITLMDSTHKSFAKAPFQEFLNQVQAVMPKPSSLPEETQKAMASMKTSVSSKRTGRTDVIQGMRAEETEITFSVDMAVPGGSAQAGPLPLLKMVMQFWTARPEETTRNAALRQLAQFRDYTAYFASPAETLQKILVSLPWSSGDLIADLQELSKNSPVMLKFHMAAFAPMMAQLAQQAGKQQNPVPGGFDPNAPLMEMSIEIAEISTAAIEDSVFEIPHGFQAVALDDLMKAVAAAASPAKAPAPR
ncbi:MAG TPA: hypothetical protein VEV17_21985 [Bryobacteraceae bacterium]|nr:hypothetical protein [Bryobacteraceae bacterium]